MSLSLSHQVIFSHFDSHALARPWTAFTVFVSYVCRSGESGHFVRGLTVWLQYRTVVIACALDAAARPVAASTVMSRAEHLRDLRKVTVRLQFEGSGRQPAGLQATAGSCSGTGTLTGPPFAVHHTATGTPGSA